jgi:hypothetical protein
MPHTSSSSAAARGGNNRQSKKHDRLEANPGAGSRARAPAAAASGAARSGGQRGAAAAASGRHHGGSSNSSTTTIATKRSHHHHRHRHRHLAADEVSRSDSLGEVLPLSPELLLLSSAAAQAGGLGARTLSAASSFEQPQPQLQVDQGDEVEGLVAKSRGSSASSSGFRPPSFLLRAFGGGGGGSVPARPASAPPLTTLHEDGAAARWPHQQQQLQASSSTKWRPASASSPSPSRSPSPSSAPAAATTSPPCRRRLAEHAAPREIAKGFAQARHQWWSLLGRARAVDVWPPRRDREHRSPAASLFAGCFLPPPSPPPRPLSASRSTTTADADALSVFYKQRRARLVAKIPDCPGLYVWLARPPASSSSAHSRSGGLGSGGPPPVFGGSSSRRPWVPLYLGKSVRLRQRLASYFRPDGGFGPIEEPFKLLAVLDLMRRGFDVQLRFRPAKISDSRGGAKADESAKLRAWDFPLNATENGGRRPVDLPSGERVSDFPVVDMRAARMYEAAAAAWAAGSAVAGAATTTTAAAAVVPLPRGAAAKAPWVPPPSSSGVAAAATGGRPSVVAVVASSARA